MKDIFKKIYCKNKFALILPESTGEKTERTERLAATVAINFAQYNMIMDPDMVNELAMANEEDIIEFYQFYEPILKDMIGADFKDRRLFYNNFPDEVIEKNRIEIFLDQLIYAYSGFSLMPDSTPAMTYFPYTGKGIEKKLTKGSQEDFDNYIKNVFAKPIVFTPTEKEIIEAVINNNANFIDYYPKSASKIKENNIYLLNKLKDKKEELFMAYATKYLNTPTDVLRYAVTLVGGDPSLNKKMLEYTNEKGRPLGFSFSKNPKNSETRSLSKPELKEILALLNNTKMDISKDYAWISEEIKANKDKFNQECNSTMLNDVKTYLLKADTSVLEPKQAKLIKNCIAVINKENAIDQIRNILNNYKNERHKENIQRSSDIIYNSIQKIVKEKTNDVILVDDAVKTYEDYYKQLAKLAHINPNNAKTQVEKVLVAICNNNTRSIYSLIEKAIQENDIDNAVKYLKLRPTELNKRMDKLIEIAEKNGKVDTLLEIYAQMMDKASVGSLLEAHSHFESRKYLQDSRIISYNGKTIEKEAKQPFKKSTCEAIQSIIENNLKDRFKDKTPLGKVYIDDSIKKVKIPKNDRMRNASESLYPYTYGSSLPYTETKTKQFAIKWEDGTTYNPISTIDLDLSCTALYKDGHIGHIGWNTGYKDDKAAIIYSGDIRHGGSAEFINCDLRKLREKDVVGLIPSVNIYCGANNFAEMLDCQMILSERNDMDYGKTYEAKTVKFSLTPKSNTSRINPVVLNVKTGEWVWLDALSMDKDANRVASLQINELTTLIREAIFRNEYAPGFDLLIKSQPCEIVNSIEEADLVYSQGEIDKSLLKDGAINITQNDLDILMDLLKEEDEIEIEQEIEIDTNIEK